MQPFTLLFDIGLDFTALLLIFMQHFPMSLQHVHEPRAVAAAAHVAQASPHALIRLRELSRREQHGSDGTNRTGAAAGA